MSPTSFFAAFENKEALMLTFTKIMFDSQFAKARSFAKELEPLMVYCLETSLQIYNRAVRAVKGALCGSLHLAEYFRIYL